MTCTVWSMLLIIRMTRPELGLIALPPPGGGASTSTREAFRLTALLQPWPPGAAYQIPFFFP